VAQAPEVPPPAGGACAVRDATELLAGGVVRVSGQRAAVLRDALLALLARAAQRGDLPASTSRTALSALVEALHAAATPSERLSDVGHASASGVTLVDVGSGEWVSTAEAGVRVGLGERQVRRLASAGLVAHRRVHARMYLVDVSDLSQYLRRAAS
jgi:hypothetical protein